MTKIRRWFVAVVATVGVLALLGTTTSGGADSPTAAELDRLREDVVRLRRLTTELSRRIEVLEVLASQTQAALPQLMKRWEPPDDWTPFTYDGKTYYLIPAHASSDSR